MFRGFEWVEIDGRDTSVEECVVSIEEWRSVYN
jgi:hypothetical protein